MYNLCIFPFETICISRKNIESIKTFLIDSGRESCCSIETALHAGRILHFDKFSPNYAIIHENKDVHRLACRFCGLFYYLRT